MTDECHDFFQRHRGGSGAVVVVMAYEGGQGQPTLGIFGSLETAQSWMASLGDRFTSVVVPFIVDDPDWGNEAPSMKRVRADR